MPLVAAFPLGLGMDSSQKAWTHLQVVLGIFPRVDAALAVVLGVNTAMSGVLFSKWPTGGDAGPALVVFAIAFALFSSLSFLALYRAAFPDTEPAGRSIIFFGDVSKLSQSEYSQKFLAASDEHLATEILHQVWRNSSILSAKYRQLQRSFGWLLASLGPWIVSLLLSAMTT